LVVATKYVPVALQPFVDLGFHHSLPPFPIASFLLQLYLNPFQILLHHLYGLHVFLSTSIVAVAVCFAVRWVYIRLM
jgi:hypothetical protein